MPLDVFCSLMAKLAKIVRNCIIRSIPFDTPRSVNFFARMVMQLFNIIIYFCYVLFSFSGIIVYVVNAVTLLHEVWIIPKAARARERIFSTVTTRFFLFEFL